MKIIGVGTDIVNIKRIEKIIKKYFAPKKIKRQFIKRQAPND